MSKLRTGDVFFIPDEAKERIGYDYLDVEHGNCVADTEKIKLDYSTGITYNHKDVKVIDEKEYVHEEWRTLDLDVPAERLNQPFTVVRTAFEGGGTGMGPHDVYPDGHHVYCVGEDGLLFSFYQSGCFIGVELMKNIDVADVVDSVPVVHWHSDE